MRMIWQAIRAVTVEVMGIGAVIFLLFGAAGWTLESAVAQPKQEVDRAWKWLQDTKEHVTTQFTHRPAAVTILVTDILDGSGRVLEMRTPHIHEADLPTTQSCLLAPRSVAIVALAFLLDAAGG